MYVMAHRPNPAGALSCLLPSVRDRLPAEAWFPDRHHPDAAGSGRSLSYLFGGLLPGVLTPGFVVAWRAALPPGLDSVVCAWIAVRLEYPQAAALWMEDRVGAGGGSRKILTAPMCGDSGGRMLRMHGGRQMRREVNAHSRRVR